MLRQLEDTIARRQLKLKKKRLIEEFRAAGGTVEQLNTIKELVLNANLSPEGLNYFSSRLIPIVQAAYDVAHHSRSQSLLLDGLELVLPFAGATLALGSSGLFREHQEFTLFLMGTLSAATAVIHGWEKVSQPALEWYSARAVFTVITREVALWSGKLNGYTDLPDTQALILLQQRCEQVMGSTEFNLQEQIRNLIDAGIDNRDATKSENDKRDQG